MFCFLHCSVEGLNSRPRGAHATALNYYYTMATNNSALSLYRAILRAARALPTRNRKVFVLKKARAEFAAARTETDPARLAFLLDYAAVSLDNIRAQAVHLHDNALFSAGSK